MPDLTKQDKKTVLKTLGWLESTNTTRDFLFDVSDAIAELTSHVPFDSKPLYIVEIHPATHYILKTILTNRDPEMLWELAGKRDIYAISKYKTMFGTVIFSRTSTKAYETLTLLEPWPIGIPEERPTAKIDADFKT